MKVYQCFLILILFNTLSINAQELINPPVKINTAFTAGENLTYQIRYGFIVGGLTTISLTEDNYQGKEVFHARAEGQTTGLADKIYGIEDIYESWFDKKTNLPYQQIRNISEGHYKHFNEVNYNRQNNTVTSKLTGIHPVPEKILDLASAFYYIRRIDFSKVAEGDVIFVNMYFADEVFPFRLIYNGKDTIRTKFGKMVCHKISPIVEVGRMFKSPDDMTIWLTDDQNCLPVAIRMDIRIVGAIYLKLIKYDKLANPMASQP